MVRQSVSTRMFVRMGLFLFPVITCFCLFFSCGDFTLFGDNNEGPTAVASASPQTLSICDDATVELDGTGSSDPDGDTLTYAWAFSSKPTDSEATITDSTTSEASFIPDVSGSYVLQLTVTEAGDNGMSDTAQVTVTVNDATLKADAGEDRNVCLKVEVELDGSGSQAPETCDTQGLTFTWELTTVPEGSTATLDDPNVEKPKFEPDVMGTYTASLTVEIGGETDQDTVTISATPLADAGDNQSVVIGTKVDLDGSASVNPVTCSNEDLDYAWVFTEYPTEDPPTLDVTNPAQPSFTPDTEGEYVLTLTVTVQTDTEFSDQAEVTVNVTGEALTIGDMATGPYKLTLTGVVDNVFGVLAGVLPIGGELEDTLTLPDPAGDTPPVSRSLPVTYGSVNYGDLNMELDWASAQDEFYDILGGDDVDASFSFTAGFVTCTATADISEGSVTPVTTALFGMNLTLSNVDLNTTCEALCGTLVTCDFDQTIEVSLQGDGSSKD